MPKSLEELKNIHKEMKRLNEQADSALAAQRREQEAQSKAIKAEGKKEMVERIEKAKSGHEKFMAWHEQVDFPASQIFGVLSVWDRLPEGIKAKDETLSEISQLRERAQNGDTIAQQILEGVKTRLAADRTIQTTGLPNLDWKPKEELPSKP